MYYKEANPFLDKLSQHVNKLIPEHAHIGAYVADTKEVYIKPKDDNNQIGKGKGIREINIRKSKDKASSLNSSQGAGFTFVEGGVEGSGYTYNPQSVRRDNTSSAKQSNTNKYEMVANEFINSGNNLKTAADGTQFSGMQKITIVTTNKFGQSVSHELPVCQVYNTSMPSKILSILPKGGSIKTAFPGMQHFTRGADDHKIPPAVISTNNISKDNKLSAPKPSTNSGFTFEGGVPLYKGVDYANP